MRQRTGFLTLFFTKAPEIVVVASGQELIIDDMCVSGCLQVLPSFVEALM